MGYKNFPGQKDPNERAMVISDNTNGELLRDIVRRMRHYNPVPDRKDMALKGYRNIKVRAVIEDPVLRDSKNSLLVQMADIVAYFCAQQMQPNRYINSKGARNYYNLLDKVLIREVSKDGNGIVNL